MVVANNPDLDYRIFKAACCSFDSLSLTYCF